MRTFGGWGLVRVAGPSMAPTLRDGDGLLVRGVPVNTSGIFGRSARRRRRGVRPGDVVVAEHPRRPGFLVVKRAVRREGEGWWLVGDNDFVTSDSREFGAVADRAVLGRAVLRFRDPLRIARVGKLTAPGAAS
jgi:nickel-type superoxide dismutase maturation protease